MDLVKYKHNNHLGAWSAMVQSCKSSGLQVKDWCAANGISVPSYYYRQKKVWEALAEKAKKEEWAEFVEFPSPARAGRQGSSAITIEIGRGTILVSEDADAATLKMVMELALELC